MEFLVGKIDFPNDLHDKAGLNFSKKHEAINDIANNRIKLQNEYYPIIANMHGYVGKIRIFDNPLLKSLLKLNKVKCNLNI